MIVALCGPPGSGKTTVAEAAKERLVERGRAFSLVHSDQFSRRTYEQLFERVTGSEDDDWLVDGTFYRESFRDPFRGLGARFVHVTADLETCLRRNRERAEPIDEVGVHVVYREFEPIDADLAIDTDDLSPDEAVDRAVRAIERWDAQ